MKKERAHKLGEQLRIAFEVSLKNCLSPGQPNQVTVLFSGVSEIRDGLRFDFIVKWDKEASCHSYRIIEFGNEIERILPNVKITNSVVCFSGNYISLTAKELGKKGTYHYFLTENS